MHGVAIAALVRVVRSRIVNPQVSLFLFQGAPIRLELNKLNMYSEGGFFAKHVDTPHEGQVRWGLASEQACAICCSESRCILSNTCSVRNAKQIGSLVLLLPQEQRSWGGELIIEHAGVVVSRLVVASSYRFAFPTRSPTARSRSEKLGRMIPVGNGIRRKYRGSPSTPAVLTRSVSLGAPICNATLRQANETCKCNPGQKGSPGDSREPVLPRDGRLICVCIRGQANSGPRRGSFTSVSQVRRHV